MINAPLTTVSGAFFIFVKGREIRFLQKSFSRFHMNDIKR